MISKEECQKNINERGNVCDRCGRELTPIETVDNANNPTYWAGCLHGGDMGHYTSGVKKEIYEMAKKLVLDGQTQYYLHEKPNKEIWFMDNVSYFCSILARIEYLKTNKPRLKNKGS